MIATDTMSSAAVDNAEERAEEREFAQRETGGGADPRRELVRVGLRCSAAQHRLVVLAAELDISGAWRLDGASTPANWIAQALDVEVCTAREWVRIGRALRSLAAIDAALAQGRISYSKARTLTRVATAENQHELLAIAERTPAGRLAISIAAHLARHEEPADTEERHRNARGLTWRVEPDGMVTGTFRLAPADAAVLIAAVDTTVMRHVPDVPDDPDEPVGVDASADASDRCRRRWPSIAQQRADALVDVARGGGPTVDTEVIVHVRGDGCTLDDGTPIAGTLVERLAPASFLRVLIHDAERRPINASGRQRHPTVRQKRVVRERDRCCVDCGATDLLEDDHVPAFSETGRTHLDELQLRCRDCHRARHERS